MAQFVLIREHRQNDETTIRDVIRSCSLSLVFDSFVYMLMKEVTFQLIVLISAIMFIFIGVPLMYCILSIPIVLILMYFSIYTSYLFKSIELFQGQPMKCWVAEACEPFFFTDDMEKCDYVVITEHELMEKNIDIGAFNRKVVGTVALNRHVQIENSIWLYRFAVEARYRKRGIGCALAECAIRWSRQENYQFLELVVTECQDTARKLFTSLGLQLQQMYHKQIIGSALTVLKYQLSLELRKTSTSEI